MRLLFCAWSGVVAGVCPAVADDATGGGGVIPDTVYVVPEIVIEAPRVKPRVDDVLTRPGFVAVLDMGERRHRVEDLATVLSQSVGLRVRSYGGLGSFATASIRGSSANQVEVYLDGVPLSDGYNGVTNLGDLPLDGVDRIDVYRGFTPPQLGSSAIGGAIDLRTYDAARRSGGGGWSRVEARASYGSFNTERLAASWWGDRKRVRAFAHVGYLASDGDFSYVDDISTPENPDDNREAIRRNNDFDSWNVLARAEAEVPRAGNIALSYNGTMREQGVPGVGSRQSETARAERDRHLAYARWAAPTPDRLAASATGFYAHATEQFHDPNADIGLLAQETDNTFRTHGGQVRLKLDVPALPLRLEAFHESKRERFEPTSHLPTTSVGPEQTRAVHTTTASGDLFLHRLNLVLTATGRFLRQSSEFYDPPRLPWLPPSPQGEITRRSETPQFGFRWLPLSFVTIKANWGDYVRLPTMLELFGNQGSVTGNGGLEPETGRNRDIGVVLSAPRAWRLHRPFLEVVYVDNRSEDLILYFPNSQFTVRPENIGSARVRGWEVSLSALVGERLRVAGNYTRLDTEDTGPIPSRNGNELPGRPRDDLSGFVDYARGRWKLSYEYHFMGENFVDPANMRPVPARNIHNLAVGVLAFGEGVRVTLEGRNLSDNQVSDVSGFPLPGRSFYATVDYKY